MSDQELQDLDRRRGKIRRGTFLRNVFLGKKEPKQIPEVNRDKYIETARWAANLNQIAKQLNTAGVVEIEELRRILSEFRRSLIGLKDDTK
jgi:hypothetical protein